MKRFDARDYWDEETNEDLTDLIEWAKERTGLAGLTYTSSFRIAESYECLGNHVQAEEMLYKAIELKESDAVEAQRSLARIYERAGRFELAVKTTTQVIHSLESVIAPSEEQVSDLKADRKRVARWKKSLSLYDEAMETYQRMLEEDEEDYEVIRDILFLLDDRNDSEQILELLDSLGAQVDSRTGNDRLTQLLLTRADDEDEHGIISQYARKLRLADRIRSSYEEAIKIAAKNGSLGANVERGKQLQPLEAVIWLKHSLASLLHRYSDSRTDILSAMRIWEELVLTPVPPSLLGNLLNSLMQAADRVALFYLSEARAAGPDSEIASTFVKKVKSHFGDRADGLPCLMEPEELDSMLAYYYASIGQEGKAREMLKTNVELGVALLSDEDDLNDHIGLMKLANSFMRLGDDENALAAWSLIAPDKNLPPAAANSRNPQQGNSTDPLELATTHLESSDSPRKSPTNPLESSTNGTSPLHSAETPDHIASNGVLASDAVSRPALSHTQTSRTKEKPKGPLEYYCECYNCNTTFSFADNFWVCKQCINVFFAPICFEKLCTDKLRRHVCDKSHDFFFVPPWDFEKARKLGRGNVQVGEEVVTVKDWVESIRREWGIQGRRKAVLNKAENEYYLES